MPKSIEQVSSHKDLVVWQKSMFLCKQIYLLTEKFPSREQFGITSQMRRAAVSIPSNIAEGRNRGTPKDFCYFLRIAYGSASELETQLILALELGFCKEVGAESAKIILSEVSKMLRAMIKKLS